MPSKRCLLHRSANKLVSPVTEGPDRVARAIAKADQRVLKAMLACLLFVCSRGCVKVEVAVLGHPPLIVLNIPYSLCGRSKATLNLLCVQSAEWIRVRVHQMEPDLMDVGATLEEAIQLQREHMELLARLKVSPQAWDGLAPATPAVLLGCGSNERPNV